MEEKYAEFQTAPTNFELSLNFPNPFNPATTIRYALPQAEIVTLQVYNLLGEVVATLVDHEPKEAGYHLAIWNGRNTAGSAVANGVYFYRLRAGNFLQTRKMVVVE
jgi:flagellar hook assembly protein FlgD